MGEMRDSYFTQHVRSMDDVSRLVNSVSAWENVVIRMRTRETLKCGLKYKKQNLKYSVLYTSLLSE